MDSRCAKVAAKLAIAECLRFGVTTVSALYYYPNATAEAIAESGFIGIFTGGLKASAGGIAAAVFSGLLVSLIFRGKDKT